MAIGYLRSSSDVCPIRRTVPAVTARGSVSRVAPRKVPLVEPRSSTIQPVVVLVDAGVPAGGVVVVEDERGLGAAADEGAGGAQRQPRAGERAAVTTSRVGPFFAGVGGLRRPAGRPPPLGAGAAARGRRRGAAAC